MKHEKEKNTADYNTFKNANLAVKGEIMKLEEAIAKFETAQATAASKASTPQTSTAPKGSTHTTSKPAKFAPKRAHLPTSGSDNSGTESGHMHHSPAASHKPPPPQKMASIGSTSSSGEEFVQRMKEARKEAKKAKLDKHVNRAEPVVVMSSSYLKEVDIPNLIEVAERKGIVVQPHQSIKEPIEYGVYICSPDMSQQLVSRLDGRTWYSGGFKKGKGSELRRKYYHMPEENFKKKVVIEYEGYYILFYNSFPSAKPATCPTTATSPRPSTSYAPSAPPPPTDVGIDLNVPQAQPGNWPIYDLMDPAVPTLRQDKKMKFEERHDILSMAQNNNSVNDGAKTLVDDPKGSEVYVFRTEGLKDWKAHLMADTFRWKVTKRKIYDNDNGVKHEYYVFDHDKKANSGFQRFLFWDKKTQIVYMHYVGNEALGGKYPHGNEILQKRTYYKSSGLVKDKVLASKGKRPTDIYHTISSKGSAGIAGILPNPRNERQVR